MSSETVSSDPMPHTNGTPPLEARGITKTFVGGDGRELPILSGVDFQLASNEAVAIVGASGRRPRRTSW